MVQYKHKQEISKLMKKTGLTPKDSSWLQKFQLSVNEVIRSLGGDAKILDEYTKIAKSWNETSPPEELQRK